ncbi:unnamed protein product [Soboliphyme baturini]|uniref:GST N-terminal domain-containing protein n=1 Tax=Soboliphyme baturini TaxID=241478 RepID=A0A183IIC0_9BILA|nr:unnamed protein product [Soboliphyme baturini]
MCNWLPRRRRTTFKIWLGSNKPSTRLRFVEARKAAAKAVAKAKVDSWEEFDEELRSNFHTANKEMAIMLKCGSRQLQWMLQFSPLKWSSTAAETFSVAKRERTRWPFFQMDGKECVQLKDGVYTIDDLHEQPALTIMLVEHWLSQKKLNRSHQPRFWMMNSRERVWAKEIWYKDCSAVPFYMIYPYANGLSRLLMIGMLWAAVYALRGIYFVLVPNKEDNIFCFEHWQKVRSEHYKHKQAHSYD